MRVTVVTDSTATLPDDVAGRLGIVVVPIRIVVGDRSYRDGVFSHRELLEATEPVTTSGPPPQDFLDVIERHGSEAGVIILTVSHDLGGSTYLSAQAAATASSLPVKVIDTATAAGAQGLVALAAARAADSGMTLEQVESEARRVIERVRLVATLPSLDQLARSGHVPGAAAWAGRWLGLHLVIELRGGRVHPLKPTLSAEAAVEQMLEVWGATRPVEPADLHLAGLSALDTGAATALLERVREEVHPAEEFTGPFGTAMIVHSGAGVFGLAWWWDEKEG